MMHSLRAEYSERNLQTGFIRFVIGVLLVLWGNNQLSHAFAGEKPASAAASSDQPEAKPHKAQKRDVDAVIVLLVLTLMVIILAFAGLLIWGRRVRRVAKQPLKTVPLPDPLWYLRGRAPVGEGDRPAGANDSDSDATPH